MYQSHQAQIDEALTQLGDKLPKGFEITMMRDKILLGWPGMPTVGWLVEFSYNSTVTKHMVESHHHSRKRRIRRTATAANIKWAIDLEIKHLNWYVATYPEYFN